MTRMRRIFDIFLCLALLPALAACAQLRALGDDVDAPTEARQAVVAAAGAQVGAPYRYRGAGRTGFDDSGFVYFAYNEAGFDLPREREAQLRAGQPTRFAEAQPGDLVFHRIAEARDRGKTTLHVGLYVGDGDMLHASLDRDEVVLEAVDNNYWFQRRVAVIKVLP